ncbi:hypothetical protein M9Y10_015231 [Tritrichomonas musculus]|uniref:Uncharacterized protein n=1 Tax=Tritrichomonas musculus TaxID=1915356 RepID=A0ABR2L2L9_9EUKA
MSVKSIDVSGRKIDVFVDWSELTQDEIDRLLYDIHIRVFVNVSSDNDTIKIDTNVNIDVDDNYC